MCEREVASSKAAESAAWIPGAAASSFGIADLLYISGGVARTPTFFSVGRNGILVLPREREKDFFGIVSRRNRDAQLAKLVQGYGESVALGGSAQLLWDSTYLEYGPGLPFLF